MQINCPSCAAQYVVPDAKVVGRAVKCARCGEQWTPVPADTAQHQAAPHPPVPVPDIAAASVGAAQVQAAAVRYAPIGYAPAAAPAPAPPVPVPRPRPARRARPWGLIAAWAGSLLLLAGLATAAYLQREEIMQAWPPSARLFLALGLR